MLVQDIDEQVFGTPDDAETEVAIPAAEEKTEAPAQAAAPAAKQDIYGAGGMVGFEEDELGATRSQFPIDQYKGSEGRKDIISLLTTRVGIAKTHWDEGKDGFGRFYCMGPESTACCKYHGPPSVRYVLPIVIYDSITTTDDDGNEVIQYKKGGRIRLGYLKIDREKYDHFRTLRSAGVDPTTRDFVVSCSDAKFQKLHFTTMNDARWRKDEKVAAAILAKFADVSYAIRAALAKTITPQQFASKHGQAPQTSQTEAGFKLSDID